MRCIWGAEVVGSSPTTPTNSTTKKGTTMTRAGKILIVASVAMAALMVVLATTAPKRPADIAREKPARFEVVEVFSVVKRDGYVSSTAEVIKDKVTGECYLWISNRDGGLTNFECPK